MEKIQIIGTGTIGAEYAAVLNVLNIPFEIIGRNASKNQALKEKNPSWNIVTADYEAYWENGNAPKMLIIATQVEFLANITAKAITSGIQRILVEKPLALSLKALIELQTLATEHNVEVFLAYNRRNYQSVLEAQKMIIADGGISSLHFDFTEAISRINPAMYNTLTTEKWVLSNSTHVIDTAFALMGAPKAIHVQVSGNAVTWHPSGSVFTGLGVSDRNIPFTYHANWESAGRWGIEIMTKARKLILRPMEELWQQPYGSFQLQQIQLENTASSAFKPGFYNQTVAFVEYKNAALCDLKTHILHMNAYNKIAGYGA